MNNTPPPNRQPNRGSRPGRPPNRRPKGRPQQNRGNPNRPRNPGNRPNPQPQQNRNPYRNGQVPPQYNGYAAPQNNYNNHNACNGTPYNNTYNNNNGEYYGYGYNQPRQRPYGAPYGQQQPDPEYLRRRRELERRQAEARRQEARDRERREKQHRKVERERRFRRGLKILGGRLLVFSIILILLCALTGILFLLFFNHTPDKPDTSGTITYSYGGSEMRKTPIADAVADNVVYFCFNDLAEYLGMSESGTAKALKFILPSSDEIPRNSGGTGSEEILCFYTDSINIEINGQSAQLDIPSIIRGTEIWVASDFITDYTNNLSFQYNERKSTVLISRMTDEENSTKDETVYLPVSFKLKNSDALEPLPESAVLGTQE